VTTVPDEIFSVSAIPGPVREHRSLAVGMNLGRLSGILAQAGDATAPHFGAEAGADRDVPAAAATHAPGGYLTLIHKTEPTRLALSGYCGNCV
jgi:hypothetical protein